jgi:hypothetical protein
MSPIPLNDTLKFMHQLCIDSYTGAGGYLDGSYIEPFARESDVSERKKNAYYINNIKGIVDSLVNPVFANEIERENTNDLYEAFIDDCTGTGINLTKFLNEVGIWHKLLGQTFIIMDNYLDLPVSYTEAINTRKFPYLYYKLPNEVRSYTKDALGNLTSIDFYYETVYDINENCYVEVYRHIDEAYQYDYSIKNSSRVLVTEKVENTIGKLPVICTGTIIMPIPSMYSLCDLSKTIYNQASEARYVQRSQSFSILVIPGQEKKENVTIGPNNIIWVDDEASQMPDYISPDTAILSGLDDSVKNSLTVMADLAKSYGAIPVTDTAKSGVAYAYEFIGNSYTLTQLANTFENIEYQIFNMFGVYTNTTQDIIIKYDTNYIPGKTQLEDKYKLLVEAINLDLSPTASRLYKIELVETINMLTSIEMNEDIETIIENEILSLPVNIDKSLDRLTKVLDLGVSPEAEVMIQEKALSLLDIKVDTQSLLTNIIAQEDTNESINETESID